LAESPAEEIVRQLPRATKTPTGFAAGHAVQLKFIPTCAAVWLGFAPCNDERDVISPFAVAERLRRGHDGVEQPGRRQVALAAQNLDKAILAKFFSGGKSRPSTDWIPAPPPLRRTGFAAMTPQTGAETYRQWSKP